MHILTIVHVLIGENKNSVTDSDVPPVSSNSHTSASGLKLTAEHLSWYRQFLPHIFNPVLSRAIIAIAFWYVCSVIAPNSKLVTGTKMTNTCTKNLNIIIGIMLLYIIPKISAIKGPFRYDIKYFLLYRLAIPPRHNVKRKNELELIDNISQVLQLDRKWKMLWIVDSN